jgi:poly(beta-D-mannuronate) lyase
MSGLASSYRWVLVCGALLAGCGHRSNGNGGAAVAAVPPSAPAPAHVFPPAEANDPLPACGRTVPVAGSEALAAALTGAQPGDCLVLADGEYTFPSIGARATADRPIVIRAQNRHKAVVSSGDIELRAAAHVVIEGLLFTSAGSIQFRDAEHCRLSRCRVRPSEPADSKDRDWVIIGGKSHHNRIDHNDFGPKTVVGNMVMVGGSGQQIAQHNRIDRNYFHDISYGGGNGWETIRLGLSGLAPSSGFNVVELNLFRGTTGDPETISVKSSDSVIRYNTYRATKGEITLRHGNRNQVHGNHLLADGLDAARGIRVLGADHRIFDNTFVGIQASPAILLRAGSHPETDVNGREFYRVYRAQVVNNTIIGGSGITVGGGNSPLPPLDCRVANNHFRKAPAAVNDQGQGTKVEGNAVANDDAPAADGNLPITRRALTEADVGPDAP